MLINLTTRNRIIDCNPFTIYGRCTLRREEKRKLYGPIKQALTFPWLFHHSSIYKLHKEELLLNKRGSLLLAHRTQWAPLVYTLHQNTRLVEEHFHFLNSRWIQSDFVCTFDLYEYINEKREIESITRILSPWKISQWKNMISTIFWDMLPLYAYIVRHLFTVFW